MLYNSINTCIAPLLVLPQFGLLQRQVWIKYTVECHLHRHVHLVDVLLSLGTIHLHKLWTRVGRDTSPVGPRMEDQSCQIDSHPQTHCDLLEMYDINQFKAVSLMPKLCLRWSSRISWSAVSKVALRSSKTRRVTCWQYIIWSQNTNSGSCN